MSHNLLGDIVTRQWSCIFIVAQLLFFCTLINVGECLIDPAPEPVALPTEQELLVFNPMRNITCLGAHTDIGWNLNWSLVRPVDDGRSMQELCAHPTYGGIASFTNLGGYCHEGDVFFSQLGGYNAGLIRSVLECRNRYFCNHGLQDPNQQPKSVAETRKTFDRAIQTNDFPYTIALDRRARPEFGRPHLLTRLYGSTSASHMPKHMDIGIMPANTIQCDGPLPGFRLPDGFDQHDFANNQALCATQLAGGNPAANAGAYCHRTIHTNERVISFADDQTPRISWTWDGENGGAFLFSAAVRFHCWKNCICQDRTKLRNYVDPQVRMWEWLVKKYPQMHIGNGNRYPMGSSTDSKGKPRTSSRGANNPSNQCAATSDKPATCTPPWPFEVLGPLPKALKMHVSVNPPPVEDWDQDKTCGNVCSDYNDCGGDCLCRLPSGLESRAHGWDLVGQVTRCMDVASVFG